MDIEECRGILKDADLIYDEDFCEQRLRYIANLITRDLYDSFPIVFAIMGGAVIFTGKLLPLLHFPIKFDYLHVSRYRNQLTGSKFEWLRMPIREKIEGQTVLILDDILDEGQTLYCVREKILELGAKACYTAVFANKKLNKDKPIKADYVALEVPDRYVFGYGMDIYGYWRNLPGIYAFDKK